MSGGLRHIEFRGNTICNKILPAFIFSCTNLTDIVIPTNCETIDSSSLSSTSISHLLLSDSVYTLGDQCLKDCRELVSLDISNNKSLKDCINLCHITIPSSIVFIGDNAFRNRPLLILGALIQNKSNKTLVSLLSSSVL